MFFRPFGADLPPLVFIQKFLSKAGALGCILAPLRGCAQENSFSGKSTIRDDPACG
jgi:hypothetical protein